MYKVVLGRKTIDLLEQVKEVILPLDWAPEGRLECRNEMGFDTCRRKRGRKGSNVHHLYKCRGTRLTH